MKADTKTLGVFDLVERIYLNPTSPLITIDISCVVFAQYCGLLSEEHGWLTKILQHTHDVKTLQMCMQFLCKIPTLKSVQVII